MISLSKTTTTKLLVQLPISLVVKPKFNILYIGSSVLYLDTEELNYLSVLIENTLAKSDPRKYNMLSINTHTKFLSNEELKIILEEIRKLA